MYIYQCQIELHDSLFFATREIGRLYETEPILHNYALCYALGLVDSDRYHTQIQSPDQEYRYFCPTQVPQYEAHLTPLNDQGIYVTPARPIFHTSVLNTWKYADNHYHVEMKKTQKNIPSFGRAKEIAPESEFECFILTEKPINFVSWIRLGKWASKAKVNTQELPEPRRKEGIFSYPYPLNPLDVMFTHQVIRYDVINMPPVSLIRNVQLRGAYYEIEGLKLQIPARMEYRFE